MNEGKTKKCPKCYRKLVGGSEETLDDAFRCTRGGNRGSVRFERYNFKIQPYYCEKCGYIEFYKEKKN